MTPRCPSLIALAGIAAVLCLSVIRAAEQPVSPALVTAPSSLDTIEAAAPKDWKDQAGIVASHLRSSALIESNTLQTGEEFYRASNLFRFNTHEFRICRMQYELLLAAVAQGDANAEMALPSCYDIFMDLIGRSSRFDFAGWAQAHPEFREFEAAPACIQMVWRGPAAARTAATNWSSNPEIKTLVDADQADRRGDWSNRSKEEGDATQQRDKDRNSRVREIVVVGDLHTADDFARAALVMQHSGRFAGYRVAHELAVAAMLLGDRSTGRWLVAATYDRMLRSVALDQRFGTQMGPHGPIRVDEAGICDNERTALGCPALAVANSRSAKGSQVVFKPTGKSIGGEGPTAGSKGPAFNFPDGWTLRRPSVSVGDSMSFQFEVKGHPKVDANLFFRMRPPSGTTADIETTLHEHATAKEADRRHSFDNYRNRADSFQFQKNGDQAALSWIADFTNEGAAWQEYIIRIAGPNNFAMLFVQAPVAEIDALRTVISGMADTVRLP